MKYTRTNKIVSLVLSMLMLLSMPLCILGNAAETSNYPIIYLPDIEDIDIYQKPDTLQRKEVFSVDSSDFLSAATSIVTGLFTAAADAEKGAAQVNSAINKMFKDIKCDEHGDSVNKTLGVETYLTPVSDNESEPIYTDNIKALVEASGEAVGGDRIFVFQYDWRLDPVAESEKLKNYIDKVLVSSHSSKARLISGGYGGIIVNSYLYTYAQHAAENISSCVFLDTMMMGTSIIGDLMSGHLVYTVKDSIKDADSIFDLVDAYDVITGADVGDAFAKYIKQDPGGMVSGILANWLGESNYTSLVSWFALTLAFDIIEDEGMFDKIGKGYKEMLVLADDGIYSGSLTNILRNMPGMWAMVPEEDYEDAIKFMFGSKDNVDSELLEKIESYRNVLENTEKTLKKAHLNGINVDIVAGYDLQVLPITATVNEQSDGLVSTRYAGVGATTGDMSTKVTLDRQCPNAAHDHVEPNDALDASTCFLPEYTWFIKDHEHMNYSSETAAAFVCWLSLSNTQRNVYQNVSYPQFMQKAILGDKVYAYSTPSDSEVNDYVYGDLDVDGKITAADARLALRHSVGLEESTKILTLIGDVNGSGKIDSADARLILRFAVGLDKSFDAVADVE